MRNFWMSLSPILNPENDGSLWSCLAPNVSGMLSVAAGAWTICVPQPFAGALAVLGVLLFGFTCRAFIRIGQ